MLTNVEALAQPVPVKTVYRTWWPLAASWALMGVELPAVSAVIARLPDAQINLAAYGGVVFALALIIEAPIIMLLAASTALSKDWDSYQKLRRFMMAAGGGLTVLHILVAFTPLFDLVVRRLIGAPAEVVEPARIGMRIMTPWTWFIAYRRFQQGVLIRTGHSRAVGIGTLVRLVLNLSVLLSGFFYGGLPGIVVGTSAVITGVVSEAVYVGFRVRSLVHDRLKNTPPVQPVLTLKAILDFYIPLAMTSLLFLVVQPLVSAALSRMPDPLSSLAAWPVLSGLLFILRTPGVAYNEVVVALLDEPASAASLRRFTALLTGGSLLLAVVITATPMAAFWFVRLSALPSNLADLAQAGLWIGLPLPALTVLMNWFQGVLMNRRHTRAITEAVVVYLIASGALLTAGVLWGAMPGLVAGMVAFVVSVTSQTAWLGGRSRIDRGRL